MSTKTIVITRPIGQARQQVELLQNAIYQGDIRSEVNIISLPLLTIVPKDNEQLADVIASALKDADLAIFVSPNAIESVMRLLERQRVYVWFVDRLGKRKCPPECCRYKRLKVDLGFLPFERQPISKEGKRQTSVALKW